MYIYGRTIATSFFKMIYGINKVIIDLTSGTQKDRPGCPINIVLLTTSDGSESGGESGGKSGGESGGKSSGESGKHLARKCKPVPVLCWSQDVNTPKKQYNKQYQNRTGNPLKKRHFFGGFRYYFGTICGTGNSTRNSTKMQQNGPKG